MLGTLDFTGSEHFSSKHSLDIAKIKTKDKIKLLPLNCIQITFLLKHYTSLNLWIYPLLSMHLQI